MQRIEDDTEVETLILRTDREIPQAQTLRRSYGQAAEPNRTRVQRFSEAKFFSDLFRRPAGV